MKRTDVVLTVGTLATVSLAVAALAATGALDGFLSWVWERHHNVLSWYIRPLCILPLAYFLPAQPLWHRAHARGFGDQHVLVPHPRAGGPEGGGVPGVREEVAHRRVDRREDRLGPGRAADTRGAVPGFLEAVGTLGFSSSTPSP